MVKKPKGNEQERSELIPLPIKVTTLTHAELTMFPNEISEDNFSGVIYTVVYKPHEGFANFALARLELIEGTVSSVRLSQPYAPFETRMYLDIKNSEHLEKMRSNYPGDFRHV